MGSGRRSTLWASLICLTVVRAASLAADDLTWRRVGHRLSPFADAIQVAKLTAPRATAGAELGRSVAVDGHVIVVGAPGDVEFKGVRAAGEAHVFVAAGGSWRYLQRLVAPDRELGDSFGRSVAVSGDTLAVGAEHDEIDGLAQAGSVYVYVLDGRRWTLEAKLLAPDARAGAHFGHSIALEGDVLAVGTWGADTLYVFERTGSSWSEPVVIWAAPGQGGNFGHSVAISKDTLAVGAERRAQGGLPDAGGASVFRRTDAGWLLEQDLAAADAAAGNLFGTSVAIDGNVLVVGAPRADGDLEEAVGAAYVFERVDRGWEQRQQLVPCSPSPQQLFGSSVALEGGRLLVGSPWDHVGSDWRAGSAQLFRSSGSAWLPSCVACAGDAASWDLLGEVAISRHTAVVGARLADLDEKPDAGAAYVFLIP